MSERPDDEDLEELRQERMEELKEQQEGGEAQEAARQQAEAQKKALLRKHLTDDARKRLNTLKMSKPQHAEQVEQQILALAKSGRVQEKIDDTKMKKLLKELKPDDKDFNIRRR
jgi:programmed cell death protein 5